MSTYKQLLTEDRRLTILRILLESAEYRANEFLLNTALSSFAHSVSADQLRTDLAWLQEQGVIKLATVASVQIAELNRRGQDVALGRAEVPGIKRPSATD